jgi:hypothetical protein
MPGVDYERLAFWDELADDIHIIAYRAPEWLDRERLKTTLVELDPEDLPIGLVIDDIVEGVAGWLYWCWLEYRGAQEPAGPSIELKALHKALSQWVDKHIDGREGWLLLRRGDGDDKRDAIAWLLREMEPLIEFERLLVKRPPGRRGEDPKTTFLKGLYHLYKTLSGKSGLSNDGYGPGVRFMTECAALFNITVPPRVRQTIMASISRTARAKMGSE